MCTWLTRRLHLPKGRCTRNRFVPNCLMRLPLLFFNQSNIVCAESSFAVCNGSVLPVQGFTDSGAARRSCCCRCSSSEAAQVRPQEAASHTRLHKHASLSVPAAFKLNEMNVPGMDQLLCPVQICSAVWRVVCHTACELCAGSVAACTSFTQS